MLVFHLDFLPIFDLNFGKVCNDISAEKSAHECTKASVIVVVVEFFKKRNV